MVKCYMCSIKLVFWHNDINNYGDLLSPYIIGKLSECEIIQKNFFVGNGKSHLYHFAKTILSGDLKLKCRYQFPFEKTMVGIGSILFSGNHRSKIWGSGFMSKGEKCNGGTIYALRGKLSLAKINEQISDGNKIKLAKDFAIGDPAMILPLLLPPSPIKRYDVGIIPHFSETNYFKEKFGELFHIIDLQNNNIEEVTSEITSCRYILSTSLHGIIVAHAYGIQALWIEHTGLESHTKGFKFKDYFSSVDIPEYSPIRDLDNLFKDPSAIQNCFQNYNELSLPKIDIGKLQHNLLKAAPFKIRAKFFSDDSKIGRH